MIQRIKLFITGEKINKNTTEGIEANVEDLANYAVFCLIKLDRESKLLSK